MGISIFDFSDYRAYIKKRIGELGPRARGFQSRMAEAMNCQKSFVTKVLSPQSTADFSLEQAERLNSLFEHSTDEASFFLLLVQFARAGTPTLREHFRDQMKQALNRRLKVKKDSESRNVMTPEDHLRYYSAWYYAAIRVAVSIPGNQTPEALAKRFQIPLSTVKDVLSFLVSRGLCEKKGDRYVHASQSQLMLPGDHPSVNRHHANWRLRALSALDQSASTDLHYSYLVTMSEGDALRIRSMLVKAIEDVLRRAAPSKSESLYSFCLDYFEL
jgi:uncharacterized protein (TIGR02147 family)